MAAKRWRAVRAGRKKLSSPSRSPERSARRPKAAKRAISAGPGVYVQEGLAGLITRSEDKLIEGPRADWNRRRPGRRRPGRWAKALSLEQISRGPSHLRMLGDNEGQRVKNGAALAGHSAEAIRDATTTLPSQLRRSVTWDHDVAMAQHADLKIAHWLLVHFCDPQSPWQRGTTENVSGLLRQYFPKGTDLSLHDPDDLDAVAAALNGGLRKTLRSQIPAEALDAHLPAAQCRATAATG